MYAYIFETIHVPSDVVNCMSDTVWRWLTKICNAFISRACVHSLVRALFVRSWCAWTTPRHSGRGRKQSSTGDTTSRSSVAVCVEVRCTMCCSAVYIHIPLRNTSFFIFLVYYFGSSKATCVSGTAATCVCMHARGWVFKFRRRVRAGFPERRSDESQSEMTCWW